MPRTASTEASAAYSILGDEDKRARFDKGEIDGTGAEQAPRNYYRDYAASPGGDTRYQSASGFSDFGDGDDIFSSFFSRRGRGQSQARGNDMNFSMDIDFLDATNGSKEQITLPTAPRLIFRSRPAPRTARHCGCVARANPATGRPGGRCADQHSRAAPPGLHPRWR